MPPWNIQPTLKWTYLYKIQAGKGRALKVFISIYQFQNGLNGLLEIDYLTFLMHENGMASIWIPQCRKQILIILLTFSFDRLNWIFAIFPSLVEMCYWYLCPSGDQRIRNIIKFPKSQVLQKNGKNYCFVNMEEEFWLKILSWNSYVSKGKNQGRGVTFGPQREERN